MRRALLMIAPDGPTLGLAICSSPSYKRVVADRSEWRFGAMRGADVLVQAEHHPVPSRRAAYILIADGLIAAISYGLILVLIGAIVSTVAGAVLRTVGDVVQHGDNLA